VHARTTTPEFCCAPITWSRLWGVTRNPWNTRYSPGGASPDDPALGQLLGRAAREDQAPADRYSCGCSPRSAGCVPPSPPAQEPGASTRDALAACLSRVRGLTRTHGSEEAGAR
jgi:hypothetical protein